MHTSEYQIVKLCRQDFANNSALIETIIHLIEPNYENPRPLVEREFHRCDTLYIIKNQNEILMGCLMASWEMLTNETPSVYLGLGMVRPSIRNTGILKILFNKFIEDAQCWESQHQKRLTIWATTASPFAYFAIFRLFKNLEPSPEGIYSENGEFIISSIRKHMRWNLTTTTQHPFTIYQATHDTYYSQEERERIAQAIKDTNFTLFSKLNIHENNGDRLLLIFQVPPSSKHKVQAGDKINPLIAK